MQRYKILHKTYKEKRLLRAVFLIFVKIFLSKFPKKFFEARLFKLSVADALLGILIKDMDTGGVDCNLNLVACLSARTGGYSCDNVLTVGSVFHSVEAEVEVNLRTHKLGYVDVNFHRGLCERLEIHRLVVNCLGTNTEDNVLVYVLLKSGVISLVCGELNCGCAEHSVEVVLTLHELAAYKVHLRSSYEARNEEVAG